MAPAAVAPESAVTPGVPEGRLPLTDPDTLGELGLPPGKDGIGTPPKPGKEADGNPDRFGKADATLPLGIGTEDDNDGKEAGGDPFAETEGFAEGAPCEFGAEPEFGVGVGNIPEIMFETKDPIGF